jgi:hypothetical protein
MVKAVAEGRNRKQVPFPTKIFLDLVLALPVLKEYHFAFVYSNKGKKEITSEPGPQIFHDQVGPEIAWLSAPHPESPLCLASFSHMSSYGGMLGMERRQPSLSSYMSAPTQGSIFFISFFPRSCMVEIIPCIRIPFQQIPENIYI